MTHFKHNSLHVKNVKHHLEDEKEYMEMLQLTDILKPHHFLIVLSRKQNASTARGTLRGSIALTLCHQLLLQGMDICWIQGS